MSASLDRLMESHPLAALGVDVAYFGRMPRRPADYHRLVAPARTTACVYVLLGHGDRVLYVGKAYNPAARFDKHRRKWWWGEVRDVAILYVRGETRWHAGVSALHVETVAIHLLDPAYNVAQKAAIRG